jgi:Skp family chaperone for outer membrane proteins
VNSNRALLAVPLLTLALVGAAVAQGPAIQPRPQAPAPQINTNVPVGKVAVIYSVEFQDPKTGIARFTNTLNKLNSEFQKVQDDLTQTAQRLKTLQDEINRLQQAGGATPAQIQAKMDTLDQQKREYTRKGEDAKAQYQKRYQDLFSPLQDEVSKALDAFAKAHGITLIIDGTQMPLIYAAAGIDITKAFISEYNIKNPATAAVTPPR